MIGKLFRRANCLLVFITILTLIGCGKREVIKVVDPAGRPIAGANVEAVSPSMNAGPNITDGHGECVLPSNMQGVQWVQISKAGFEAIQVDIPKTWPLCVTLKPATRP